MSDTTRDGPYSGITLAHERAEAIRSNAELPDQERMTEAVNMLQRAYRDLRAAHQTVLLDLEYTIRRLQVDLAALADEASVRAIQARAEGNTEMAEKLEAKGAEAAQNATRDVFEEIRVELQQNRR